MYAVHLQTLQCDAAGGRPQAAAETVSNVCNLQEAQLARGKLGNTHLEKPINQIMCPSLLRSTIACPRSLFSIAPANKNHDAFFVI